MGNLQSQSEPRAYLKQAGQNAGDPSLSNGKFVDAKNFQRSQKNSEKSQNFCTR